MSSDPSGLAINAAPATASPQATSTDHAHSPAASPDGDSAPVVISVENVGKCYHIYERPSDRLKQALFRWRGRLYHREFWALRNVDLRIRRGESIGIVGMNGSGKSTLLQLIAGTLTPTEGRIGIHGRVGALLELGSGFNPEFTGRENVMLAGAILGIPQKEMLARFDDIAAFADIGEFLDQPIKTYSSGMLVRLAFAVQVQVDPDILIVDEALAVGDSLFQKRCYERLLSLRDKGTTLLFVSHSHEAVRTLTTRGLLLHHGRVKSIGEPSEVLLDYRRLLHEEEMKWRDRDFNPKVRREEIEALSTVSITDQDRKAFGGQAARVLSVEILDGSGVPNTLFDPGEQIVVRVRFKAFRDLDRLNVGLRIRNKEGVKIYSWGTLNQDISIWSGRAPHDSPRDVFWDRAFRAGQEHTVDFVCDCPLGASLYEVQACVSREYDRYYGNQEILHWRDEAAFFTVGMTISEYFFGGVADLRMKAIVQD